MREMICENAYFGFVLSIGLYYIGVRIHQKWKHALLNPLLIAVVCSIAVLLIFDIDYETYNLGARYLSYLLTPATVCLAIPLYQHLTLLKDNLPAVIISVLVSILVSAGSILLLCALLHLSHIQYVTLLPKSITTAIGISVSEELGGQMSITVVAIVITGIFGNIFGETAFKLFGIRHSISKGLAIGAASHAIGTARAMEIGEVEGSMSSLAMALSGILTAIFASFFAMLY